MEHVLQPLSVMPALSISTNGMTNSLGLDSGGWTRVQVYTAPELNALADFYATPLGRSALQKMPQAYKVMSPAMEQEVNRAFAAVRARTAN